MRGLRDLKRERPQTLGAEWMLSLALVWRRLLALTARDRPQRALRLDAVPPTVLDPRPGAHDPGDPDLRAVAEKIAPLRLAVRAGALERVNLLIPTFDLRHFFGGYIAKLNLARALAERGLRVRIVTVDPVGSLPRDWRDRVESYSGLAGLFDSVEVAFGRESPGLEVSRDDAFVATTWWTAHIAHAALDGGRFLYLVQEYEPFTFAMGSYAALADESYRFPHFALFSTELLRDFFRRRGLGVYAGGAAAGDAASAAFENAISAVDAPDASELAGRRPRRLLFYARPEPHAARNMFEVGVLALGRALESGAFAGWELDGIGTVRGGRRLELGGGASLRLLPRVGQEEYAQLLRAHDVGLSLMYTPHPSLVPIEMASAGMLAVTNTFENKTAEALAAISPNLIAAEPGIEPIARCPRRRRRGGRRWRPQGARQPRALVSRLGDLVRRRAARPRDRVPARIAVRVAVDGRSLAGPRRGIAAYLTGMLAALPAAVEVRVVLPRGAVLPPGLGANVAGGAARGAVAGAARRRRDRPAAAAGEDRRRRGPGVAAGAGAGRGRSRHADRADRARPQLPRAAR